MKGSPGTKRGGRHSGGRHPGAGHDMSAMLEGNERALRISLGLTGVYFLVELAIGIYSGSVAVLSDAFHTFSAVGGLLLALVASRIAARPADRYRTFGSMRAEIVGALFNGVFLVVMALAVLVMGVMRLMQPVEVKSGWMIAAAVGGLVTELVSLKLLMAGQKENLNVRGAFWHVVQTFVGSLIILAAAGVIYLTGFVAIDPIFGIAFGLVLVWASYRISRDALRVLMETVPDDVDILEVRRALTAIDGVEDVHHIHAWALTSGKNLLSAHLKIGGEARHDEVLRAAREVARDAYGFYFSTLQVERECEDPREATAIDFAD